MHGFDLQALTPTPPLARDHPHFEPASGQMYFQALARQATHLPVFMSALCQLPAVVCGFAKTELIAIFTANSTTLDPMRELIKDECAVE